MSSGNYMLFRRRHWWEPPPLARARIILDMDKGHSSLGSIEQVKKKIETIFPEVKWNRLDLSSRFSSSSTSSPLMNFGSKGSVWFGTAGIEFQLDQDQAGDVRSIHVSRADHSEVQKLKRSLRLTSMNLDADSFLEILFG